LTSSSNHTESCDCCAYPGTGPNIKYLIFRPSIIGSRFPHDPFRNRICRHCLLSSFRLCSHAHAHRGFGSCILTIWNVDGLMPYRHLWPVSSRHIACNLFTHLDRALLFLGTHGTGRTSMPSHVHILTYECVYIHPKRRLL
jgi:hypothetical protein